MINSDKPDVCDLLKRLQEQNPEPQTGVEEGSRAEVAPGLVKRFSQLGNQQAGLHGDEGIMTSADEPIMPDEPLVAYPEDAGLVYDPLVDESQPVKKSLFSRIRDKLSGIADPLNLSGIDGETSEVANWPRQIHIGYMTQVKKKDLLRYIGEWVSDNGTSKSACFYQIQSYNGGLAYEIQEGGSGSGALRSAIETLSRHSEVIIPSSERYLQLSIRPQGFSSYLLDEYETKVPSPEIVFKDPLKPVFSRHHGLMIAGLLSALLGVAIISASWFMVYAVYNKDKVPVYAKVRYELPSDQLRKVNDVLNQPASYLDRLEFKADKWNLIIKKSETTIAPVIPSAPSPMPAPDAALNDIQKTLKEAGQ
ncbi:hypothetical protein IFT48_04930 [Pseudomonas fluorescens]|uniref:hypothetical protein n=1 Tax=Pseudomonas TaxID=286 RepID=UPI000F01FDC6|nr:MULTISPECIES: hypothetical protein [Pseudomonas]MBD8089319.1 hypothetical protein [Pseudomonas fluorescens]MBD8615255.1 hypothetical protein [Pseudomonas putida]MBD8682092.1 hypothetical protein [Pseudomonas sp. CFBP 13719]